MVKNEKKRSIPPFPKTDQTNKETSRATEKKRTHVNQFDNQGELIFLLQLIKISFKNMMCSVLTK